MKLDTYGLKRREGDGWIPQVNMQESLSNKILLNPRIDGDLIYPSQKTNTSFGSNNGEKSISSIKEINSQLRGHKNLDEYASNKDDHYNHWTIETNNNGTIDTNIIEEYSVGYARVYGTFADFNSINTTNNNNETTFKEIHYYEGWNISIPSYSEYTVEGSISEKIISNIGENVFLYKDNYLYDQTITGENLENVIFSDSIRDYDNYYFIFPEDIKS